MILVQIVTLNMFIGLVLQYIDLLSRDQYLGLHQRFAKNCRFLDLSVDFPDL